MIRIAVITPISHLPQYSIYGDGIDMCLGHIVNTDDVYAEYYRAKASAGWYVIMDNGAFELEKAGAGLDPAKVLAAAKRCNPTEIIATDVLLNGDDTIQSTKDFISYLKKKDEIGSYRIMAVPQGKSVAEWLGCYVALCSIPEVNTIGFSKISIPVSFLGNRNSTAVGLSRLSCLKMLKDLHYLPNTFGKDVHLLGSDDYGAKELYTMNAYGYDFIRSCDTSLMVWYGSQGVEIDPLTGIARQFIPEKPDLENEYEHTVRYLDENEHLIKQNILTMKLWSRRDRYIPVPEVLFA